MEDEENQTKKIDYTKLCEELRQTFMQCTSKWYHTEFLKGKKVENSCTEEWYDFRSCLLVKKIKKKHLTSNLVTKSRKSEKMKKKKKNFVNFFLIYFFSFFFFSSSSFNFFFKGM